MASVHLSGARDDLPPPGDPLLKGSLQPEHIKNRCSAIGDPALHGFHLHPLNRLHQELDLDVIFMAGPGPGAPGFFGPSVISR